MDLTKLQIEQVKLEEALARDEAAFRVLKDLKTGVCPEEYLQKYFSWFPEPDRVKIITPEAFMIYPTDEKQGVYGLIRDCCYIDETIEEQYNKIKMAVDKAGVALTAVSVDVGEAADEELGRKAFQYLMTKIDQNDTLFIADASCFYTNREEFDEHVERLTAGGVTVKYAPKPIDPQFIQLPNVKRKNRPPYGYSGFETDPITKKISLLPDANEQKYLKLILECHEKYPEMSFEQLAAYFNTVGYPTRVPGSSWASTTVKNIIGRYETVE